MVLTRCTSLPKRRGSDARLLGWTVSSYLLRRWYRQCVPDIQEHVEGRQAQYGVHCLPHSFRRQTALSSRHPEGSWVGGMGEGDLSVVLQGRLPEPHYREWANRVKTDVRLLQSFIAANNGNLQPLDDAIAIAIAGMWKNSRRHTDNREGSTWPSATALSCGGSSRPT